MQISEDILNNEQFFQDVDEGEGVKSQICTVSIVRLKEYFFINLSSNMPCLPLGRLTFDISRLFPRQYDTILHLLIADLSRNLQYIRCLQICKA